MQKSFLNSGTEPLQLSPNFAQQVMQLQLDVQLTQKIQIQKVNRLIQLYTNAVEYYESIKSNKYIIFKNKIIDLMLKPSVTRFTQSETTDAKKNEQENNTQGREVTESKRQEMDFNLQIQTKEHELSARKMMVGTDTKLENVKKRINNQISKQEMRIEERLRMRKGKMDGTSIGSSESDPKEKEAREKDDLFIFETILEYDGIGEESVSEEKIDISIQEPNIIEKLVEKSVEIPIINISKPKQKKAKKHVLTLKPNQTPSVLPDQYSIPF